MSNKQSDKYDEAALTEAREKLAAAWCTPENEQKTMDLDLAEACAVILAPYIFRDRCQPEPPAQ